MTPRQRRPGRATGFGCSPRVSSRHNAPALRAAADPVGRWDAGPGEWSRPVGGDRPLPGSARSAIPRKPPLAWPDRRDRSSGSCRKRRADTLRGSCHSGCGQSRGGGSRTRRSARPFSRPPDERARSLARTTQCRPAGIPPSNVPGTGRAQFPEDVFAGRSQVVPSPEQNVRAAQICERSPGPIGRKRIQRVSSVRPPPDHHQAMLQVAPSPTSTKPAQ